MEQDVMTSGSAARLLERSAEAVRLYAKSGRLPATRTEGGTFLFLRSDVLRLAAELAERRGRRAR
jgi:excisionase family DNA binding protein